MTGTGTAIPGSGTLISGRRDWSGSRDEDGHREYKVKWLVKVDNLEGPNSALNTPGLPLPGSVWSIDNDIDAQAYCKQNANVTPVNSDGDNELFTVEQVFTTRPLACKDQQVDDPLMEPMKVSGTFVKKQKEMTNDRYGDRIVSSSFEQIRGPQVEFDELLPTVKIEQNVADLELDLLARMANKLNDAPLWGLDPRCVKLSGVSWEKIYYGSCYYYYKRTLEFEVNFDTFDREVLDEGTKALNGRWGRGGAEGENWILIPIGGAPPNPENPAHFSRFRDRSNELSRVILNGEGLPYDPANTGTGSFRVHEPGGIWVEYYEEDNLELLQLPTDF